MLVTGNVFGDGNGVTKLERDVFDPDTEVGPYEVKAGDNASMDSSVGGKGRG
jgi:hypothetical protein